jgi:hypothetical protein
MGPRDGLVSDPQKLTFSKAPGRHPVGIDVGLQVVMAEEDSPPQFDVGNPLLTYPGPDSVDRDAESICCFLHGEKFLIVRVHVKIPPFIR